MSTLIHRPLRSTRLVGAPRASLLSCAVLSALFGASSCSSGSGASGTGGHMAGSGGAAGGNSSQGGKDGGSGGKGGAAGEISPGGSGGQANPTGASGGSASGGAGSGGTGGQGSGGSAGSGGAGGGGMARSLAKPVMMNDVSILFPIGTASDYSSGHLRADAMGSRGVLFPSAIADKVPISGSAASQGVGGPALAPYANLRVVGVRLDPCFAELHVTVSATCKNQIRLVFQELHVSGTSVAAYDSGIHALYSITREELLALANEIVRLREAAGGQGGKGPLAPHKLIQTQGLAGSFSMAVQKLILQYAGEQNLVRATALSESNAGFNWSFSGFDVADAGHTTTPIVIATLPANGTMKATSEIFFRGFATSTDPVGSFTPMPSGPDDFTILADAKSASGLSSSEKAKLATALAHVDNPSITTPETIDCARCHTATPLGQNVARDRLMVSETSDADAFKPDGHWVTADEMVTTDFSFASAENGGVPAVNVHAFSYANGIPAINQRTVNETAAVVSFLNDSFLQTQ